MNTDILMLNNATDSPRQPFVAEGEPSMARIHEIMREAQRVGSELKRWSDAATRLTTELRELLQPDQYEKGTEEEDNNYYWPNLSDKVHESTTEWNQMLEGQIKFFDLCSDLRRNSPTVQKLEVDCEVCPDGYLHYLGDSILHCTHIQELRVSVASLHFGIENIQTVYSFVEYVQTSPTLRTVRIDAMLCVTNESESAVQFANLLFGAISANRHIRELHFTGWTPPVAFHNLLSTSTSLETLSFDCREWRDHTDVDHAVILSGFSNNFTIEKLALTVGDMDWTVLDTILLHVDNGLAKLQRLHLCSCIIGLTLQQRLYHMTSLQCLDLCDCYLDSDSADCLMEGMRALDANWPTATTTRLALHSCMFTEDGASKLISFMTTRTCNRNQHEGALLHEPNFVSIQYSLPHISEYKREMGNQMEVSIITESSTVLTASSRELELHHCSLSLRLSQNGCGFSETLASVVDNISLVCLQVAQIAHVDSVQIATCLPRLVTLRALHLVDIQDCVVSATLLSGLRQNGSLFESSFRTEGKQRFFQDNHRSIIRAYHKRNRVLIEMISSKTVFWSILCPYTNDKHTTDDSKAQIALLPKLLHVAIAISFVGPRFALAALSTLNLTIGLNGHQSLLH